MSNLFQEYRDFDLLYKEQIIKFNQQLSDKFYFSQSFKRQNQMMNFTEEKPRLKSVQWKNTFEFYHIENENLNVVKILIDHTMNDFRNLKDFVVLVRNGSLDIQLNNFSIKLNSPDKLNVLAQKNEENNIKSFGEFNNIKEIIAAFLTKPHQEGFSEIGKFKGTITEDSDKTSILKIHQIQKKEMFDRLQECFDKAEKKTPHVIEVIKKIDAQILSSKLEKELASKSEKKKMKV